MSIAENAGRKSMALSNHPNIVLVIQQRTGIVLLVTACSRSIVPLQKKLKTRVQTLRNTAVPRLTKLLLPRLYSVNLRVLLLQPTWALRCWVRKSMGYPGTQSAVPWTP